MIRVQSERVGKLSIDQVAPEAAQQWLSYLVVMIVLVCLDSGHNRSCAIVGRHLPSRNYEALFGKCETVVVAFCRTQAELRSRRRQAVLIY